MSSFKKLSRADVTYSPYAANKLWNLPFSCFSGSVGYFNVYKGTNVTGSFNSATDPITNGQYERLIYTTINHMFYQSYTNLLDTSSLMFYPDANVYASASQQRPTASYFDYNTNSNQILNFPTTTGSSIRVLVINKDLYGSKILPSTFQLSSSAYNIVDDGNGNLYDLGVLKYFVGNIFYSHGIAVLTNQNYQQIFTNEMQATCGPTTTTTTSTTTSTTTVPTTTTSTTTSTTTAPTTTTSTTTSTTTAPTTTTSTTTSTTTAPTTTTSTTTSTTTAPTTTTTSTTTTTTTVATLLNAQWRVAGNVNPTIGKYAYSISGSGTWTTSSANLGISGSYITMLNNIPFTIGTTVLVGVLNSSASGSGNIAFTIGSGSAYTPTTYCGETTPYSILLNTAGTTTIYLNVAESSPGVLQGC
jgi:hypothetical protein